MKKINESGTISIDGGRIRYESDCYGPWELAVKDIKVLGESTNEEGPFADDYFFCFAIDADSWVEASFYAEGRDEFLEAIGQLLGCEVSLGLTGSTECNSRVLWPPIFENRPMFKYIDNKLPTVLGQLIYKIFGAFSSTQHFTDEVLDYLKRCDAEAASNKP